VPESPLNSAIRHFEAAEANLIKLEKLWDEIESTIPDGVAFVDTDPLYEDNCRSFVDILAAIPAIDGWKPEITLFELNEIGQMRLDAMEVGEIECQISTEQGISEPGRLLREYRYRFNRKRRELVRDSINELIDSVDFLLRSLKLKWLETDDDERGKSVEDENFTKLSENIAQIDSLLGSSVKRPPRWSDLHRHIHFAMVGDLHDIVNFDWPSVKNGLRSTLYGDREAVPVEVEDLGALVQTKPTGPVATKLDWPSLEATEFERLIFALISFEKGYENPEWLMRTNAPDRGRDLSVTRIYTDPLGGTIRQRVIIQCKHWLSKSVSVTDVAELKEQMKLWEPPRVDVHVIATSGRFTSDAVSVIETNNQSDTSLRIEMWPESHLERLLAQRPSLIAEFRLR